MMFRARPSFHQDFTNYTMEIRWYRVNEWISRHTFISLERWNNI